MWDEVLHQDVKHPGRTTAPKSHRKLHLGCGKKNIPGFFHVDQADHPHIDHRGPVENLDVIADNAVEIIYACHLLEHFARGEVASVLREWNRVLKPGGVLRLAVPDFAAVCQQYQQEGLQNGLTGLLGLLVGGQRDIYDYHKMVFDEFLLTDMLMENGYDCVRRWDWRWTEHAHIDDYSQAYLPHMDKDSGQLMSLNLEARKKRD
jgi:predicted SAM-dependent methyltransferase